MLTNNQLKSLMSEYGFRPLKRFGENYLIDNNIKDKIIEEARLSKGDTVLEIGPGLGALTFDMLESGARVYAVEKDKKAFQILKDLAGDRYPDLKLFCEDILDFDIKAKVPQAKIKAIGNLPYYITTPIVEYLIENRALIKTIFVTVQREVAVRLLANPGTGDCSSISCFVQYYTRPRYIHTIKRTSFYPVPDVDSSLIEMEIPDRPSVSVKDEKLFFKIIRSAFNQKRKSIINSLSREAALNISKEDLAGVLNKAGISPGARPQDLSLADYSNIANEILTIPPARWNAGEYRFDKEERLW